MLQLRNGFRQWLVQRRLIMRTVAVAEVAHVDVEAKDPKSLKKSCE